MKIKTRIITFILIIIKEIIIRKGKKLNKIRTRYEYIRIIRIEIKMKIKLKL